MRPLALLTVPSKITTLVLTADHSVVSSATLVTINGFSQNLVPGGIYRLSAEFHLNEAGTVAGVRLGVTGPASPTALQLETFLETGSGTVSHLPANAYGLISNNTLGTTGIKYGRFSGRIINGSIGGQLSLQFAQSVSDPSATTIKAGSIFSLEKLN